MTEPGLLLTPAFSPLRRRSRMGRARWLPILAVCAILGCGDAPVHELSGATMGTTYSVRIGAQHARQANSELQRAVDELLTSINSSMSTYLPDSELSQFNSFRGTEPFPVSPELCALIEQALSLGERSAGAFDITVGPLVNLWGFGPDSVDPVPPTEVDIKRLSDSVGYRHLVTDCSVPVLQKQIADLYVDVSALAKGYAVDRVASLLDSREITDYLVEIGGELRLRGKNAAGKAWAIGIETPSFTHRPVRLLVNVSDVAIATSGDYRNYFEFDGRHYSHVIDPRTGQAIDHSAASVTVLAERAAFADAMATALLVMGPDKGLEYAEREGIAALFLLRVDRGFVERRTAVFDGRVEQN